MGDRIDRHAEGIETTDDRMTFDRTTRSSPPLPGLASSGPSASSHGKPPYS
jgi:hypothetical protein